MNQIVNTLISVLGFTQRAQAPNDLMTIASSPMIKLDVADFALVVGGDATNGPRGGWIVA